MNNFDWLGLITAIGSLIAAAAVFAGFTQYRMVKRDTYITSIREKLQFFSRVVDDLDGMVSTEMFYQMLESAVYGKSITIAMRNLFSLYREAKGDDKIKQLLEERIRKIVGKNSVRLTVNSPLRAKYQSALDHLSETQSAFYPNYEGLNRLINTVCYILNAYMKGVWSRIIDTDMWIITFKSIFDQEITIDTVSEFKRKFYDVMCDIHLTSLQKKDQRDINCVKAITKLVSGKYLGLSNAQLIMAGRKEKKIKTIPINKTLKVCDDFREAGKCFRTVFDTQQAETYATYVRTFELNNLDDDDERGLFDL